MMLLNEGGNIWDDTESFDQKIAQDLEKQLEKYLSSTGLNVYRIGSGATPTPGKISGDLDVMVDLDVAAKFFNEEDPKKVRIELENYLQQKGLETRRIAVTVHVKMPYGDKFHQVDIKVVKNAANVYKFHVHDIPKGSPWKGVNKQMMMNTLASSQGMLWSPDEGLYARDAAGKKAQLLSTDLDEIAQYLLGKNAKGKDLGSVESILAAIPDENKRNEIFAKARASSSWQAATPDAGTNEWFSRLRKKLV
jgi:predicted XRE-type DNA-binding protein